MKIVHVCMGFPVEYPGGITNYVRSLASSQTDKHEVTVVCNGERDYKPEGKGYKIIRYNSPIRNFSLSLNKEDPNIDSFVTMLVNESADLYHFHSLLGIDINFLNKWKNKNYIVSLHDYNTICPRVFMVRGDGEICRSVKLDACTTCVGYLNQIDFLNRISNKFSIHLPKIKSNNVIHRNDLFIDFLNRSLMCYPVSKRVGEIFVNAGVNINKCKVITIGNDSANNFSRRVPSTENKVQIAFLGTFTRIKGAELFIEMMKVIGTDLFDFNLYGRGDNKLIEMFNNLGGIYHGSYSPNELPSILSNIDIGAVLSIWEDNGPQVVMEMINNGIPVLGTSRGGIPDFIRHQETGFIFDPDTELKNAIDWLSSMDKKHLKKMMGNIYPLKSPKTHCCEFEQEIISLCE
ncbi:glycosyltransferase [Aeromonas sanarellii]|uniref:glycosyltransferase n=1 Tax=Aeromonas sanarellii TaxID=633415 RepID=UPI003BA2EB95